MRNSHVVDDHGPGALATHHSKELSPASAAYLLRRLIFFNPLSRIRRHQSSVNLMCTASAVLYLLSPWSQAPLSLISDDPNYHHPNTLTVRRSCTIFPRVNCFKKLLHNHNFRKKKYKKGGDPSKNIQQRGFAGRHRPNY